MSIGLNIKRRRYELNMSQQDLADAMGYRSKSTITKIESGENGVSSKKIEKFAKVLNMTIEELVSGISAKPVASSESTSFAGIKRIAVILAGGKSTRNKQNIPNQFITVYGKPIIIYSMDAYEKHAAISDIYVVCLKGWEDIVMSYAKQFNISKLRGTIPAGRTGILSVRNAIRNLENKCSPSDIIIFQESTRPLVTDENINRLLMEYYKKGSATTCGHMSEHLQFFVEKNTLKYIDRDCLIETQSPEAYKYSFLSDCFTKTDSRNHEYNESCCSMFLYNQGIKPNFFEGDLSNVKIIRSEDIALFKSYVKNSL